MLRILSINLAKGALHQRDNDTFDNIDFKTNLWLIVANY